jgi:pyrroloquinoline quinone biosynthesis protein D
MVTADSRPKLASKVRLRHDRIANATMLLYPEHGLVLNESAAAIVRSLDGRTVAEIAAALTAPVDDLLELLTTLAERGLVHE